MILEFAQQITVALECVNCEDAIYSQSLPNLVIAKITAQLA